MSTTTAKNIRARVTTALLAGRTPQEIADELCLDITEDGGAVVLDGWVADDGDCEIYYEDAADSKDAADSYVCGGDWGDGAETTWVTVMTWRVGLRLEGSDIEAIRVGKEDHKIAVDPLEPDCVDGGDHDWQAPYEILGGLKEDPGVWGSGGGICTTRVCMRCGCGKHYDSWAQDPADGEQGLESVRYVEREFADEIEDGSR